VEAEIFLGSIFTLHGLTVYLLAVPLTNSSVRRILQRICSANENDYFLSAEEASLNCWCQQNDSGYLSPYCHLFCEFSRRQHFCDGYIYGESR